MYMEFVGAFFHTSFVPLLDSIAKTKSMTILTKYLNRFLDSMEG